MDHSNKRQCKRKFNQIDHLRNSTDMYITKNIEVTTQSHSSHGIQYVIKMNDDMELCCNCGEKYDNPNRKNCRHVSLLLLHLYKNYANSLTSSKKSKVNDELKSLIKQFNDVLIKN